MRGNLQALCDALAFEARCHARLRAPPPRTPGLECLLGPAPDWGASAPEAEAEAAGAGPAAGVEAPDEGARGAAAPRAALPLRGFVGDEITCLSCSSRWGLIVCAHALTAS